MIEVASLARVLPILVYLSGSHRLGTHKWCLRLHELPLCPVNEAKTWAPSRALGGQKPERPELFLTLPPTVADSAGRSLTPTPRSQPLPRCRELGWLHAIVRIS